MTVKLSKFVVQQVCIHSIIIEASSAEAALKHVEDNFGDDDFPTQDWGDTSVEAYTGEEEADEQAWEDEDDEDAKDD